MKRYKSRLLHDLEVPVLVRAYTPHDDLSALLDAQWRLIPHNIEKWEARRRVAAMIEDCERLGAASDGKLSHNDS